MRYIRTMTILLLGFFVSEPTNAEVFNDDFDRPDGPLEPPWELLDQDLLYIENHSAVARADEYGLMLYGEQCPTCYCDEVILLTSFNFSTNTEYDGRFQFFIGGGEAGSDYWGFNAKIGLDEVSLYRIDDVAGETELITVPSPLMHDFNHSTVFRYDPDVQQVSLVIYGPVSSVVELSVPASSEPLCFLAIGIENLGATGDEGRINGVSFQYCCDTIGVPEFTEGASLDAWPQPFTTSVHLRCASAGPGARVEIYDVAGRCVGALRLRSGRGLWEADHLSAGVYLARIVDAIDRTPARLIKLR